MARAPLAAHTFPFHAKGKFQILVLHTLQERPMHGYEIMKVLENRFHGFYRPSSGAVYPALRALRRKGYVASSGEERRKTYRITRTGRAFLRSREAEAEERLRTFEATVGPDRAALFRELRTTGKLLGANLRSVTPEQARELRKLIIRMRERIMSILAK